MKTATSAQRRRRGKNASGLFEELIVDLFAGGGGASLGIEKALGRSVDVAINHDADAVAMHQANHPATAHLRTDVWDVDPMEATGGRKVGLLWASPDCFPAGTLILTETGYRPIETIVVGDKVLTHRGLWRNVTSTMKNGRKPLRTIRAHGHPGLRVSGEHPFFATASKYGTPDWTAASAIGKGHYLASPRTFEHLGAPKPPRIGNFWWVAGRYVADGWGREREINADMTLTVGPTKAAGVRDQLALTGIPWSERNTATAVQFTCHRREIVQYLQQHFGHRAENKTIPGWALSLQLHERSALINGYLAGDGYEGEDLAECSTVSRKLAFGLKALLQSVGHTACVYVSPAHDTQIKGRTVKGNFDVYKVKFRRCPDPAHRQTFTVGCHEFAPVREVFESGATAEVFNISVEEDESYVAEGIVVHNCRHFSRAKGATPVSPKIRSLAWVVVKWAKAVKPRVICLENVREFEDWGPLVHLAIDGVKQYDSAGKPVMFPCKNRKGETFKKFVGQLRRLGYDVQWRVLDAADFGAPTHRRRLFLVARRDGKPVTWPAPTHGPKRSKPWRTAAECIDWDIPCPSIFDRKKQLAEKTLRRIAMGIGRYVLNNPRPFIVTVNHGGEHFRGRDIDTPMSVVSAKHGYGVVSPALVGCGGAEYSAKPKAASEPKGAVLPNDRSALVAAMLSRFNGQKGNESRCHDPAEPLRTLDTQNRFGLVAASLVQTGYGEREGQAPRALDIETPLGTVVAGGCKTALVAGALVEVQNASNGGTRDVDRPAHTITANPKGGGVALAAASMVSMRHGTKQWSGVDEPLPTVTAGSTHARLVYAFLTSYYGQGVGQEANKPARTVTSKERFGLVTVDLGNGELGVVVDVPGKGPHVIADIGLRMLSPRELARCQGFDRDYVLTGTKTSQVARIGNSVCPQVAEAIVRANAGEGVTA